MLVDGCRRPPWQPDAEYEQSRRASPGRRVGLHRGWLCRQFGASTGAGHTTCSGVGDRWHPRYSGRCPTDSTGYIRRSVLSLCPVANATAALGSVGGGDLLAHPGGGRAARSDRGAACRWLLTRDGRVADGRYSVSRFPGEGRDPKCGDLPAQEALVGQTALVVCHHVPGHFGTPASASPGAGRGGRS